MRAVLDKNRISFMLCPVRHVILIVSAAVIGLYFMLRGNERVMTAVCNGFVRPYHRLAGKFFGLVGFSVAELIYAALIVWAVIYLIRAVVLLIRREGRLTRLYLTLITALTVGAAIYGGFCLLWGVYYGTVDFSRENGIETSETPVEKLNVVTLYFVGLVNEYGGQISRDENGLFNESLEEIFDKSPTLYRQAAEKFSSLSAPELAAKPFLFSRALSYINFTGFFFPFTGEANINTDSPACLIPSTIAHELAHQRGVASEDEANFVGIMACLENGDPVYCYSAALLAYIHLGNALYSADYDLWKEAYFLLDENARADLAANNEYWDEFETKVSDASETVYTGFLESYGEERGLQSYGDCIDLLIAYYYEQAASQ